MNVTTFTVMIGTAGPPPPDIDQVLRWARGEEVVMPLTDEERERIREIEAIRAEAYQQAMHRTRGFLEGPPAGDCASCGRTLRMGWRFCAFCGAPASGGCPRCRFPLPQEDGVQFCPQCGGRV